MENSGDILPTPTDPPRTTQAPYPSEHPPFEKALRESEASYRAVVEDQTELISCFRADGTYLFVNDAIFVGKL